MKTIFKVLIFLSGVLFVSHVWGQSQNWAWAKSMGEPGEEMGNSTAVDEMGNVYTTGYFQGTLDFDPGIGVFNLTSEGGYDIFVSKLDNSGNFIWAKATGGNYSDKSYALVLDSTGNGGIYTTGSFQGTVDFDPGIGTFYLSAAGTLAGKGDIFISKLDFSGNFMWAKQIGGIEEDYGTSIAIDASSNIFLTGIFRETVDFDPGAGQFNLNSGIYSSVFISKLSSAGNYLWAKAMSGIGNSVGLSITTDLLDNVYTTGTFNGTIDFNPDSSINYDLNSIGGTDIFISKLDSSGVFEWTNTIEGINHQVSNSIVCDIFGNIYLTGYIVGTTDFDPSAVVFNLSSSGNFDIFISKYDNAGNFKWATVMGGSLWDVGNSIAVDGFANVYTTGGFYGIVDFDPGPGTYNLSSSFQDIFISKLDSMGNFVWAKGVGGTSGEAGRSITTDLLNNVYLTGFFYSSTIAFDSTILNNNTVTGNPYDIFIAKLNNTITGIEDVEHINNTLLVSPNPTISTVIITTTLQHPSTLTLYDITGRTLLQQTFNGTIEINVFNLARGMYIAEVQDKNGNSAKGKLLKE